MSQSKNKAYDHLNVTPIRLATLPAAILLAVWGGSYITLRFIFPTDPGLRLLSIRWLPGNETVEIEAEAVGELNPAPLRLTGRRLTPGDGRNASNYPEVPLESSRHDPLPSITGDRLTWILQVPQQFRRSTQFLLTAYDRDLRGPRVSMLPATAEVQTVGIDFSRNDGNFFGEIKDHIQLELEQFALLVFGLVLQAVARPWHELIKNWLAGSASKGGSHAPS